MTIFQQQHDGRAAQAVPCKGSKPGSIPGRAFNSRVAQLAERGTVNAQVRGSNPRSRANFPTEVRKAGVLIGLENRDLGLEALGGSSILSASASFQRLGSSVVEHSVETRGVAGSIPALCTIFNMVGSSVVELRSPKPSVVGSIPTRHAIFKRMCDGAVTCRPAKTRPTLTGGGGSIPPASAILTRVRLLLVVGRQIVNLLIRNTVGSIPTARTTLRLS